jgi:hypothetical protein
MSPVRDLHRGGHSKTYRAQGETNQPARRRGKDIGQTFVLNDVK